MLLREKDIFKNPLPTEALQDRNHNYESIRFFGWSEFAMALQCYFRGAHLTSARMSLAF